VVTVERDTACAQATGMSPNAPAAAMPLPKKCLRVHIPTSCFCLIFQTHNMMLNRCLFPDTAKSIRHSRFAPLTN
jgi:hypothetical protein